MSKLFLKRKNTPVKLIYSVKSGASYFSGNFFTQNRYIHLMRTIRKAQSRDLPAIYSLVRELAIYENSENELTATAEDYENDFADGIFESLVLEDDGEIRGMVLYYMTYSTWRGKMLYLEDFVVTEEYRRTGCGQELFEAFLKEAHSKKCRMVKWQVLDWNEPAIRFYEKNKATIEKNWWNVKIIF